ncbi:MAG: S8 family peptidase [Crocinitomicaceae bacterium]|jgi:subtilisin family serine protease|tara:strand:+ start:44612 stop:45991 length:1380 start_codon:yes stop_codon:yes gene_type:complete
MMNLRQGLSIFGIVLTTAVIAQPVEGTLNWYNQEGQGMYTEKAYKYLKKKESKTVIVGVIDSGVDIEHEDLKGKIWINTGEIAGNGIDDDNNGYIDDIHGWNFLGNAAGEHVNDARLEKTRILASLMNKYDGIDPNSIEQDDEFKLYLKVKEEVNGERAQFEQYMGMLDQLPEGAQKYIKSQMDYNLNVDFDDRSLIGDDPDDFSDVVYGNADVEGPDALHGTHVSGIIGAVRGNELGGDGVAENVKIMVLRAVPNGDEFDKDIALAVRYAVDNGADVINMSFGKAYSPHQKEVYAAFKYADKKGVLLIHAAGNDAKDIDVEPNFPTSKYSFQDKPLDHFVTIGASTKDKGAELVASFSNYGAIGVDVFAPGFEIYNAVPQSEYMNLQGTSMAAPMVAGAAAMLKSYYPELSMKEIKEVLYSTSVKYPKVEGFADKSVSGGVVNLYKAAKACKKLAKKK